MASVQRRVWALIGLLVLLILALMVVLAEAYDLRMFTSSPSIPVSNGLLVDTPWAHNILRDLAVGVITSDASRARMGLQLASWATPGDGMINVTWFGDSDYRAPHVVKCNCPTSIDGLPCKTETLFSYLYHTYPDKKWFYRAMDDSCVDPMALAFHLSKLDPDVPLSYGDPFFVNPRKIDVEAGARYRAPTLVKTIPYPGGGVGWILTRAAMKIVDRNWPAWRKIKQEHGAFYDDLYWGYFMHALNISAPRRSCLVQRPEVDWYMIETTPELPLCTFEPSDLRALPTEQTPYPPLWLPCAFHMEAVPLGWPTMMCPSFSHLRGQLDVAFSLEQGVWKPCRLSSAVIATLIKEYNT